MKKTLTYHGKKRVNERTNISENKTAFIRKVSRLGKTKNMYKGKFYQYLSSKSRGSRVKVYDNYIYIMAKNSKSLITVYPVPEKYLPTEQYEVSKNLLSKSAKVNNFLDKMVTILMKDGSIVTGYILKEFVPMTMKKVTIIKEKEQIKIDIDDIEEIKECKDV